MENQSDSLKNKLSPKYFFLSLGVLITLITSVIAFLNLIFQTLEKKFPDVLNATYDYGYSSWNYEGIRSAIATLIIVFPVFLVLSYFWRKASKVNLGHIDEIIRKWMVYLILFIAGIVAMVDLVVLVKYFVSGEITLRFVLKVVATLVVAKMVGVFYLTEIGYLKRFKKITENVSMILAPALVIFGIIWSFSVIGSPKDQRNLRLDERRVQDLQSIQWQVINYYQQKSVLPKTLTDLSNPISGFRLPVEPEFQKGLTYEYINKGGLTFDLCATFAMPMPKGWQEYSSGGGVMPMMYGENDMATSSSYPFPGGQTNDSWDHQIGRTCFERTIDKDIYPPFEKEPKIY